MLAPLDIGVNPDLQRDDHPDKGLEGDADKHRAHQIDKVAALQRGGHGPDPRLIGVGDVFVAPAQAFHTDKADDVQIQP